MPKLLDAAYLSALSISLPYWIYQSAQKGKYRQGWSERFFGARPTVDFARPRVWIHAVSLGEVLVAKQIVEDLAVRRPDVQILLSTTTDSGLQVAQSRIPIASVFRSPLDFSWAVQRVADHIAPSLMILTELELWPHLLLTARERRVPVCVANARVSDRSFRGYKRFQRILSPALESVRWWGAQTDEYAERIRQMVPGDATVEVTGSIKYEGALRDRQDHAVLRMGKILGVRPGETVWVAGSTMIPEESIVLDVYRRLVQEKSDLRLILVPRHPERFDEVIRLLDQSGLSYRRRSQCSEEKGADQKVVLVDSLGELAHVWGLATIGFVGGSLTKARGGQSMIEPAGFGVPCCFGPSTSNFRATVEQLLAIDGARRVRSADELTETLLRWLGDPAGAEQVGGRARQFIQSQQGALRRTMDRIERFLPRSSQRERAAG
jgi:3-deoxy-D-manno-octulosonic-acid transferase